MILCPYCGASNQQGGRFCGACGKELPVQQEQPAVQSAPVPPPVQPEAFPNAGSQPIEIPVQQPIYTVPVQNQTNYVPPVNQSAFVPPAGQLSADAESVRSKGILWLVLNSVSILLGCCCFPLIPGVIGIIFSSIGISQVRTDLEGARNKVKVGMIMFIVAASLLVLYWIIAMIQSINGYNNMFYWYNYFNNLG